ncbi:MAG: hypothetical protein RMJ19_04350, partial [Gemmatales bacterium]|nr:hypothetical protein [Gemmatales bacterium]MDW8174879.1 hypothetical protein [Gemmatales bacterium]
MSARIGLVDALRSGVAMLSKVGRGVVLPGMFMLSLALAAGAPGGANRTEVQGKSTCGDYGTAIEFEATPKEAAKRAA